MVTNALILTTSNGSAIPDLNIIMQNPPQMLLNNMTIEREHHSIPKESTVLAAEARERILHAALPEVPLVAPPNGIPRGKFNKDKYGKNSTAAAAVAELAESPTHSANTPKSEYSDSESLSNSELTQTESSEHSSYSSSVSS